MPSVLLTPIAGGLADRFNRRMLIGDSLSAIGLIFIYFHIQNGTSNFLIIIIGVTISSMFSSLLEPSYRDRATITEILTPDEFSKASGLVQLAGTAKFLFAPMLAGLLLQFLSIEKILLIDIGTIFVTIGSILFVMRASKTVEKKEIKEPFLLSLKTGWHYMVQKKESCL